MASVRQSSFLSFVREMSPVFRENGFKRKGLSFVREKHGLVQRIQCRRYMDLEDQYWIAMYLWIECRSDPAPFGRLVQSFDRSEETALFEPFDPAAVARAVSWHTHALVHRIMPIADRLFDRDSARAYDWVRGALEQDGVSLQVYDPK
jgi:hypothetical protein